MTDKGLLESEISPFVSFVQRPTTCNRISFTPAEGICANIPIAVSSCTESVDQLTTTASQASSTIAANGTARFWQSHAECLSEVSSMCVRMGGSVLASPLVCESDFLCASDRMFNSLSLGFGQACGDAYNNW